MATRPECRPRDQDRRRAARCRPVFPFRDWYESGKSMPSDQAYSLPYLSTPVSPFHAEPLHFKLRVLAKFPFGLCPAFTLCFCEVLNTAFAGNFHINLKTAFDGFFLRHRGMNTSGFQNHFIERCFSGISCALDDNIIVIT